MLDDITELASETWERGLDIETLGGDAEDLESASTSMTSSGFSECELTSARVADLTSWTLSAEVADAVV